VLSCMSVQCGVLLHATCATCATEAAVLPVPYLHTPYMSRQGVKMRCEHRPTTAFMRRTPYPPY